LASKGREIHGLQFGAAGVDHGKLQMAVGAGAAVAGDVFHHRRDAARQQPLGCGAARRRRIQHRQAVDVDPDLAQIMRHQSRAQPCQSLDLFGRCARLLETRGAGIGTPMRRAHALHAAAFLIDQDRRIFAPHHFAEACGQAAELIRAFDIALEEDEPPWAMLTHEGTFLRVELIGFAATDKGLGILTHAQFAATKQSPPCPLMRWHMAEASSRLMPPTRTRQTVRLPASPLMKVGVRPPSASAKRRWVAAIFSRASCSLAAAEN